MSTAEVIGYSASAILVLSFLLSDIRKLRIVNILGCALFMVYGFLLDNNWPIIIPNIFIIGVNIFHLLKMPKA